MFNKVFLRTENNDRMSDYYCNVDTLPKREDTIIYYDDKYEIIDIELCSLRTKIIIKLVES